jgi:hypothetical protein
VKSPRTTHEFDIDPVGLDVALQTTWQGTPEEFVKMARLCFGLPIDGPPPMWHFLEIMQIVQKSKHLLE